MYIKVIGKDIELFNGKEIFLFGCGSCGQRALEEFEGIGANILGFCDNSSELHGRTLSGYPIYHPDHLKQYPKAAIMITSTYEKEIEQQLKEMQLTNYYRIKLGVLKETIAREQFSNQVIMAKDANSYLRDSLSGQQPFLVGRLGSVELEALSHFLYFLDRKQAGALGYPDNVKMMMNINAGFFPCEDTNLDRFCSLYLRDLQQMDLIWSMWFSKYEDLIYRDMIPGKLIAAYDESALPLEYQKPWTQALEGKKVLVIHPFEASILENYQNRKRLFSNAGILPDFDLKTIKAVQSIAGNRTGFTDWFEALDSMKQQMENTDFDIALIGAGAYGLPLGAYAKELGKKAVHLGGILQLYFGIKGRAWDKLGIYNEYWTSPRADEFPEGYVKVEAGRYW